MAYMRLGDLLVASGTITEQQLERALALQKETKQRLGDALIQNGFITEAQLIDALRVQLGVDFVDLTAISIPVELAGEASAYILAMRAKPAVKRGGIGLIVGLGCTPSPQ